MEHGASRLLCPCDSVAKRKPETVMLARLGYVLGWIGNIIAALFLCGAIYMVANSAIDYATQLPTTVSVTPVDASALGRDSGTIGKRFLVTSPDGQRYDVKGVETAEAAKSAVDEFRDVGLDRQQRDRQL